MKLSHRNKQILWGLAKVVGLTALCTSPAWAVTGLVTDAKSIYGLESYVPGMITLGATGAGLAAITYGGWHAHKKGELEQQGKPVGMKHIAFPIIGGSILAGIPWVTGSAQKTIENMTTAPTSVSAGSTSGSVTIP
ncbi:hypothetical protein HAP94_24480 [Acidithiobacillus ferrivorans]|uniref:Uncharacterized protein n=1 Tax=mine drainage metagenome TaxID=410659 RepID=E6QJA1_9ZZZZ|nr:hypothetical protein [Acidithiobacillus ferrivorans]